MRGWLDRSWPIYLLEWVDSPLFGMSCGGYEASCLSGHDSLSKVSLVPVVHDCCSLSSMTFFRYVRNLARGSVSIFPRSFSKSGVLQCLSSGLLFQLFPRLGLTLQFH